MPSCARKSHGCFFRFQAVGSQPYDYRGGCRMKQSLMYYRPELPFKSSCGFEPWEHVTYCIQILVAPPSRWPQQKMALSLLLLRSNLAPFNHPCVKRKGRISRQSVMPLCVSCAVTDPLQSQLYGRQRDLKCSYGDFC